MSAAKVLLVLAIFWIGIVWPISWTALLLTLSLSVLCLSTARERCERHAERHSEMARIA